MLVFMNGPHNSLFSFKKTSLVDFIFLMSVYQKLTSPVNLVPYNIQFKKSPNLTQVINYSCGCYFQLSIRKING